MSNKNVIYSHENIPIRSCWNLVLYLSNDFNMTHQLFKECLLGMICRVFTCIFFLFYVEHPLSYTKVLYNHIFITSPS